MKILLTGGNSSICKELVELLPSSLDKIIYTKKDCDFSNLEAIDKLSDTILSCNRIVIAHGCITSKLYKEMTEQEILYSLKVNLLSVVRMVEIALDNPNVRIAVIGSESGIKGSHDISYGLSKIALHKYIEERRIKYSGQQLVCVAPSLIVDSGMTARRHDQENVKAAILKNPKGRGLFTKEVAQMICSLLFIDMGYTTNTVIHMNGGKYARS